MSADQTNLEVVAERPIVRNDGPSDVDIIVDLVTSTSVANQAAATYSINLCMVIDRSGSMNGPKLEQAKQSCIEIWESLNPGDNLTILAFDDDVISVANPQTPRNEVKERIRLLSGGGSTNLSKGWYLGLLELKTYTSEKHLNRVVLLSDGQANRGEQKASVLGEESGRARDELGITTSTIGIGNDFQEDILVALAHHSGGRFWYIGDTGIQDIIREEFSGALSVYLQRPSLELTLPEGVTIVRELNELPKVAGRYRTRPIKANDRFSLAVRLRIEPEKVPQGDLQIGASLLDGTTLVKSVDTVLRLGTVEEYAQSPEEPRVGRAVTSYLTAAADEKMAAELDSGEVTTVVEMLEEQSALMRELEQKLAGEHAKSWEEAKTDQERAQARRLAAQAAQLQAQLLENNALAAVMALADLLQGLGEARLAQELFIHSSKSRSRRAMDEFDQQVRSRSSNWEAPDLLLRARRVAEQVRPVYPHLEEEFSTILRSINEQLARFS